MKNPRSHAIILNSCSLNSAWMQRAPIAALWSKVQPRSKPQRSMCREIRLLQRSLSARRLEARQLDPGRECEPQCWPYRFVRTLERMGASIEVRHMGQEGREAYGIIEAAYTPRLTGCEIPKQHIASVIDEIPVLALVAAHAHGRTVFRQVSELTKKESNRLDAIIEGWGSWASMLGARTMTCSSTASRISSSRKDSPSTRARITVLL